MPCRSDYLEPNTREIELRRAARLYIYVQQKLGAHVPKFAIEASHDSYCRDDRPLIALCDTLNFLSEERREAIVYNAHDPVARDLADWWEDHQAADAARIAKEQEEAQQKAVLKSALNKLTEEELRALGASESMVRRWHAERI